MTLTLRAGSTVAIVGDNGASKSRIVKLLIRLYDQDFAKLHFTVRESVGFDEADVADAIQRAGADGLVAALADGLETPAGTRVAGGVELSEGQWQKLALGRAFVRVRPVCSC